MTLMPAVFVTNEPEPGFPVFADPFEIGAVLWVNTDDMVTGILGPPSDRRETIFVMVWDVVMDAPVGYAPLLLLKLQAH